MSSRELLESDLFQLPLDSFTTADRIQISYSRAREIARFYNFEIEDVVNLTAKFWKFHQDDICAYDISAFSLITIQYNLVAGTLARFLDDRPEYQPLLDRILNFDINAQFMLTELGHGLDARNLETTATLLDDGSFDLHTPHPGAAKYMPPTSPVKGFPRIAMVVATLVVGGEDRGVRPFVTWISDGQNMCEGITSRVPPPRAGSKPLDHSVTVFNHVRLPKSALLGSLEPPNSERGNFLSVISRISVGTLAIATTMIPILRRCAYVAGKYSLRRKIKGATGEPTPIITFQTQQLPILHTLAEVSVFEVWAEDCIKVFTNPQFPPPVRHGIGTALKAVFTKATQSTLYTLAERCGAQGLYDYNHIIESQLESRGISISEGDTLTLCIRLASELLLQRYEMPPPQIPNCLLAQHEKGVFDECRAILHSMKGGHRSEEFNEKILPRCQSLVEAFGQRMAYESAVAACVPSDIVALYEAGAVLQDSAWYVEKLGLSRELQFEMELRASNSLLPRLEEMLDGLSVQPYCTAPILSDMSMVEFLKGLDTYVGKDPVQANSEAQPRSKL